MRDLESLFDSLERDFASYSEILARTSSSTELAELHARAEELHDSGTEDESDLQELRDIRARVWCLIPRSVNVIYSERACSFGRLESLTHEIATRELKVVTKIDGSRFANDDLVTLVK